MNLKLPFKKLSKFVNGIGKNRLLFFIFFSVFILILLIFVLDLFNVEAFSSFNEKFMFSLTWKGRMFYFVFLMLFLFESKLSWGTLLQNQKVFKKRFRFPLLVVFVIIAFVYVLAVNFLGFDKIVTNLGLALQVPYVNEAWPISIEYMVLGSLFTIIIWLAFGSIGLRSYSISLASFLGVGIVFLIDTAWPYGVLEPLELLAVPIAAFATSLLGFLGYGVRLSFPLVSPEYGSLPRIQVWNNGNSIFADVAWSCAGVHSLFFYVLLALIFFKRLSISRDRKVVYFLIGAALTYLINIFRITLYMLISLHYGHEAGWVFHNSYGELLFFGWMLVFFVTIIGIESGKIIRVIEVTKRKILKLKFKK